VDVLRDRLSQCIVVIVLWSRHARSSDWVFAEMVVARFQGKAIITLKLDDSELDPLIVETHWVDLMLRLGW
jgi:hypothetical protein